MVYSSFCFARHLKKEEVMNKQFFVGCLLAISAQASQAPKDDAKNAQPAASTVASVIANGAQTNPPVALNAQEVQPQGGCIIDLLGAMTQAEFARMWQRLSNPEQKESKEPKK
jgi:hypothetical protein